MTQENSVYVELNKPPQDLSRNKFGLINNIPHVFNPDGTVNWRNMINPEHLVLNKSRQNEIEKTYEKPMKEIDPATVDDKYKLILLAGIKEVAFLRGYTRVGYDVISASQEHVAVRCAIDWLATYESNLMPVRFEALADAHLKNTMSFAKDYLMAIAENRAFVRAVRNFLRIHVLGADEVGPSSTNEEREDVSPTDPHALLQRLLESKSVPFEKLIGQMLKEGVDMAKEWKSITDIPKIKVFELIERVSKKK